jgi:hypothetical protein
MRCAVVALLFLAACRRDPATSTGTAASRPSPHATASLPGRSAQISDDELVAYTRWQRDYMDLFRRHWDEQEAAARDPGGALLRREEIEARVAEVVARQVPVMKDHMERVPLKGEKAELVAEALGGIFHFQSAAQGFALVIRRDEVRLESARRRFGANVIDGIVAREPLILDALQRP